MKTFRSITVFVILILATLFYAFSTVAAPPFRLKGTKFILKEDIVFINDKGDSLIRERIYLANVTRYDTIKTINGVVLVPFKQKIPVVVRFAASMKDLNLYGKTMEQVKRDRIGRLVTTAGVKDRASYIPDNHITHLLLKQTVMISFLGDDFTYTKYVSGKVYRLVFEERN